MATPRFALVAVLLAGACVPVAPGIAPGSPGAAVARAERERGPDHPALAKALGELGAWLLRRGGRAAEAEPLLRRSLAIRERALGPDDPAVAASLNDLGLLYREAGRLDEAAALYERALVIRERALGPGHAAVARSLNNLGVVRTRQRRYAEAEALLRRSLAVREGAPGPAGGGAEVAESPNSLGAAVRQAGRPAEALPLLARSLALREAALGPDHPQTSTSRESLGNLHRDLGRAAEAEALYAQALAARERTLGPDHPRVAESLGHLAEVRDAQGRTAEALDAIRRAADIRRARREDPEEGVGDDPQARRAIFPRHAALAWELGEREPGRRAALLDEAFRAGQSAQATDVGAAAARVAARFAAGDDALAAAVRERQDLAERRRTLDRALVDAAGRPPAERDRAREDGLRRDLAAAAARAASLREDLARRFPGYGELVDPAPLPVAEVQALLGPEEALIAYLSAGPERGVFLWLVRPGRAEMRRLELGPGELERSVRRLRDLLDPGRWAGGAAPAFDAGLAHALHAKLLPPDITAALDGARHLLVVPHGPLESLPFSVLVRAPPAPGASSRDTDWLARHHAVTTLPSVSSLRALRRFARASRAAEPFRGIGDPILDGPPAAAGRSVAVAGLLTTRGLADPARVRALPPLPETASELRSLAANLGATEASLLLRERATERAVKAGALARARVVAFASHAGVAGEIEGVAEPALVLTPPAAASEEDDGPLTAGEAARLRLDADLVLLSACNTAAPDGTPGAPGLSGLAKAFLHAGSRALLVSHWAVVSDAAERLTTGMFAELARDPALGRAEALRRSMLTLLADPARPELAHPAAWAPFVVVGEGAPAGQGGAAPSRP